MKVINTYLEQFATLFGSYYQIVLVLEYPLSNKYKRSFLIKCSNILVRIDPDDFCEVVQTAYE